LPNRFGARGIGSRMAQSDIFKIRQCNHWGYERYAGRFHSVLPNGGDIVISQESATYRPEMEWIVARLKEQAAVAGGDDSGFLAITMAPGSPIPATAGVLCRRRIMNRRMSARCIVFSSCSICQTFRGSKDAARKCRRPNHDYAADQAVSGREMWFGLFWLQPLREFWRRELGEKYFSKLQEVIPYSWLLDPTPLPQHAVIPRLESTTGMRLRSSARKIESFS